MVTRGEQGEPEPEGAHEDAHGQHDDDGEEVALADAAEADAGVFEQAAFPDEGGDGTEYFVGAAEDADVDDTVFGAPQVRRVQRTRAMAMGMSPSGSATLAGTWERIPNNHLGTMNTESKG